MRITKQRAAVLAALRHYQGHPTADQVHACVRETLPHVSLATVYRILGCLAHEGQARIITHDGGPNRYDAAVDHHHHIVCSACGSIEDVPNLIPVEMRAEVERWTGYALSPSRLDWHGVCPDCREMKAASG